MGVVSLMRCSGSFFSRRVATVGLGLTCSLWPASLCFAEAQQNKVAFDQRISPYLKLLEENPEAFGPLEGPIRVMTDPTEINECEKKTGQTVGILSQNRWITLLNDAVEFPGGVRGTYVRFFWNHSIKGGSGAVVIPVIQDGENESYVVVCEFRHSVRGWRVGFPRGNVEKIDQLLSDTAARELAEETGAIGDRFEQIGCLDPDTGLLATKKCIGVFKTLVQGFETRRPEPTEVSTVHIMTRKEIEEAIVTGYANIPFREENGQTKMTQVPFRDGFTLAAWAQFQARMHK